MTIETAPRYYRIGRIVYRIGTRHVRVYTGKTCTDAAIATRNLNATDGGKTRDWRVS